MSGGLGLKRLARELNEEGLRTRSGTRWNKAGLQKLLTNEVYVGTLVWNTGSRRKALSAPKPPVRIEDAWPAIVSRELFEAVGRTMSARSPKIIHPRQASSAYLLSGFTFCSSCRTALIGHSAKSGRYHYYLCSSRDKGRGTGCRLRMTRREVLEDVVIARTRDRLLSDENVRELVEIVNEELAVSHTERGAQTKKLDREVSDVRKRLERYYDAFERGALVAEELRPRLDELNRRLAELDAARARIQLERDPHTVSYTEVRERASHLKELLARADPDSRKLAIRSLIERIEVSEGSATVTYHLPENRTANRDERSAVLPIVPSGGAGGTRTDNPLLAKH